jgi:HD superfamily phosphohydrolase
MLHVKDNELVVEEKGIYSIENFLSARRLMYWQVYLHKTSVSSEKMLISIIQRAKHQIQKGVDLFATDSLKVFLSKELKKDDFAEQPDILKAFLDLDDYDLWGAIKVWGKHNDTVLSKLCQMLLSRQLFKIEISLEPTSKEEKEHIESKVMQAYGVSAKEAKYFFSTGKLTNNAYLSDDKKIMILSKSGKVRDVVEAADLPNIKAMSKIVRKYYRCWPKDISL